MGSMMLKNSIGVVILIAVFHVQPALSEQLTYDLSRNDAIVCQTTGKSEDMRRKVITKYNLPKNLRWQYGHMKNEWGDHKDGFCFMEYGNNIYIWRPFHFILLPDKPIEVIPLKR